MKNNNELKEQKKYKTMATWISLNRFAINIDLVKSFYRGSGPYIEFNYIDGSEPFRWSFNNHDEANEAFNSLTKQIAISTSQEKPAIDFTALFAQDTDYGNL